MAQFNNSVNNIFKSQPVIEVSTNYTIQDTDSYINVNTSSGALTITLPAPSASNTGKTFLIKDSYGNAEINRITITSPSGTIEGSTNSYISMNYGFLNLYSSGSSWLIINSSPLIGTLDYGDISSPGPKPVTGIFTSATTRTTNIENTDIIFPDLGFVPHVFFALVSQSTSSFFDNDMFPAMSHTITSSSLIFLLEENGSAVQDLKIFFHLTR